MARRGLTFIEVVVALAMLSVFATLALGSIGYLSANAERNKHRLQASELAHRVIIQYLDDREQTPDPDQAIWQGDAQYRVEFEEQILNMPQTDIDGLRQGAVIEDEEVGLQDKVQNMSILTIRVFKWDAKSEFEGVTPVVEFTRIYYPFLVDPDWAKDWLLDLLRESTNLQPAN